MHVKALLDVDMVTLEAFEHALAIDYGNSKSEVTDPPGGASPYCLIKTGL